MCWLKTRKIQTERQSKNKQQHLKQKKDAE